jgi:mRNA-degrading endonuclease RelE of RelBE toxin-antitoxin system
MKMSQISYDESPQFKKDLKNLQKRYRTLPEDLKIAKEYAIKLFHAKQVETRTIVKIEGVNTGKVEFYKIVKFACQTLRKRGANSGIRIIYAFQPKEKIVTFIEMYFKADKENEDKERIKAFLQAFS